MPAHCPSTIRSDNAASNAKGVLFFQGVVLSVQGSPGGWESEKPSFWLSSQHVNLILSHFNNINFTFHDWGDGSISTALAVQTRGPEFDPLHPRKNARCSNMYQ